MCSDWNGISANIFANIFHLAILSLSPFTLAKNSLQPKTNRLHSYLSIISTIIQLAVFVYGFWNYQYYTDISDRSTVIFIADVMSMAFIRCTSITIVIESWLKRSHQIDFLTKIDQTDRIMRAKLLIDLQYESQQKLNFRNLFGWIGAQVSLELSMVLLIYLKFIGYFILYHYFYA